MSTDKLSIKQIDSGLSPEQRAWRWRVLTATYFGYAGYYLTRKVFTICKTSLADEFRLYDWDVYQQFYWPPLGAAIVVTWRFRDFNDNKYYLWILKFNPYVYRLYVF